MADLTYAPELKPPPAEEALDTTRLLPWLRAHLPEAKGEPEVWRFTGGHANLTYLLRFGDREYVLRRPPLGPVAPGSHDMRREHLVLSRLHEAYELAPRSFLLCEDETVIGAVFVVGERRRGFTIRTELPSSLQGRPELCRKLGENMIGALADLHRVDPAAVGLAGLGQPDGFVARQLVGWARRWEAARDPARPDTAALTRWLEAGTPQSHQVSLLHNDYKLDNVLLSLDENWRPEAVLDWDMCTRGDPLVDLGYLLNYWAEPGDPAAWTQAAAMPTDQPGFPNRAEAIALYAERTGFNVGNVTWYRVFAMFKLAVILQQIYIRFLRGQTTDPRFADFGARTDTLLHKAEATAGL